MSVDDFDWSLVLLVEDLLVPHWKDVATHMLKRFFHREKIAYIPQIKSVMNRLSVLEGEAREAYMRQQRRIVLDTLNVPNQIIPFNLVSLIGLRFSVCQKIQCLGGEAPS